MQSRFSYDFRGKEASNCGRTLNRELYGASRWVYSVAATLPPVALIIGAIASGYMGVWGAYNAAIVFSAAAAAFLWTRSVSPWLSRRILKPTAGILEGRNVDYEFGEDGYRIRTETFEGFQKWIGVDRIIDSKGAILFVLGMNAHFLPDRQFASPEARREFLDWTLARLSPEARAKSRVRPKPDGEAAFT